MPIEKVRMTDAEIQDYLRENRYPEHIVRGGRAGLLKRWREFVEQAERGYRLGIESYRNDLDIRGIIALAKVEDDAVRAIDGRLKRLLTDTHVRVWESAPGDPFWDFGYPKNAGSDLLDDLRGENLLL
jgi:hypothetical protein